MDFPEESANAKWMCQPIILDNFILKTALS